MCDSTRDVLFIFMRGASFGETANAVCDTGAQNKTKTIDLLRDSTFLLMLFVNSYQGDRGDRGCGGEAGLDLHVPGTSLLLVMRGSCAGHTSETKTKI